LKKKIKLYNIHVKIKYFNIKVNIHYKFICSNKIKLEQWRDWRRRRIVVPGTIWSIRGRTRTNHLWSYIHDHLVKFFIIRRESFIFFSEMDHMLLQGRELLRLGAQYQLRALNNWDTTGRSHVLSRGVGKSVHSISIGSTRRSCYHPQI
jgi:hypothetical protein